MDLRPEMKIEVTATFAAVGAAIGAVEAVVGRPAYLPSAAEWPVTRRIIYPLLDSVGGRTAKAVCSDCIIDQEAVEYYLDYVRRIRPVSGLGMLERGRNGRWQCTLIRAGGSGCHNRGADL